MRGRRVPSLFDRAGECIGIADPGVKVSMTRELATLWMEGELSRQASNPPLELASPGHPGKPVLVHASEVPRRRLSNLQGRVAFLHALAHIEFNAINLAWDAVYRFRDMPDAYYSDWIRIAVEEATHFTLLEERLREYGAAYGDLTAHNGLWDMARRTSHDVLVRMALVPRVLEARGLDVTPAMIARIQQAGDADTAQLLDRILHDEITHVRAGTRWFRYLCEQRSLDPIPVFRALLREYLSRPVATPMNTQARSQAGFSDAELNMLEQMADEVW